MKTKTTKRLDELETEVTGLMDCVGQLVGYIHNMGRHLAEIEKAMAQLMGCQCPICRERRGETVDENEFHTLH